MSDLPNTAALLAFIGRIEQKQDERTYINGELHGIYEEVRQAGMHPGTVRQMVRERRMTPDVRAEQYRLRDEYRRALGLLADTPLGEAMEPSTWPKPFAEQTVHEPRPKRRARKLALFNAAHPQGTA